MVIVIVIGVLELKVIGNCNCILLHNYFERDSGHDWTPTTT